LDDFSLHLRHGKVNNNQWELTLRPIMGKFGADTMFGWCLLKGGVSDLLFAIFALRQRALS